MRHNGEQRERTVPAPSKRRKCHRRHRQGASHSPAYLAAQEARILAHAERVAAEMARLPRGGRG